ncbi:hypothetical protein PQX77_016788 [Marasmius sp. AFHP31]|nr:hypothetical protein PQX77_016788 [Marasmius sp. AFHP31]
MHEDGENGTSPHDQPSTPQTTDKGTSTVKVGKATADPLPPPPENSLTASQPNTDNPNTSEELETRQNSDPLTQDSEPTPSNPSPPGENDDSGVTHPNAILSTAKTGGTAGIDGSSLENKPEESGEKADVSGLPFKPPEDDSVSSDDEDEEDDGKSKKPKRRGNPGTFTGDRLEFLESYLLEYLALGARSKAKKEFWRRFIPRYLELLLLKEYPLPPRKDTDFKEKSESQIRGMSVTERRSYRAKVKHLNKTDGERLLEVSMMCFEKGCRLTIKPIQMVQNWFRWRQGKLNDYGPFKKFLEDLQRPRTRPRKRQGCHILLRDPDYDDAMKSRTKETGPQDRLSCRLQAAREIIADMTAEEKEALEARRREEHRLAMIEWGGGFIESQDDEDENENNNENKTETQPNDPARDEEEVARQKRYV